MYHHCTMHETATTVWPYTGDPSTATTLPQPLNSYLDTRDHDQSQYLGAFIFVLYGASTMINVFSCRRTRWTKLHMTIEDGKIALTVYLRIGVMSEVKRTSR